MGFAKVVPWLQEQGGTIVFTVGGARMSDLTCVVDVNLTDMPDSLNLR